MGLEQVLNDLKQKMTFKKVAAAGDIILVGMKAGLFYGLVPLAIKLFFIS